MLRLRKRNPPAKMNGALKEFMDVMKTRSVAPTSAGVSRGRVTDRKLNQDDAPRLRAASMTAGSMPLSAAEVNR